MGGRLGVAAALGVLVASEVAFAEPGVSVHFARPADPRGFRPQLCLGGACGELDEDGQLPLVIGAPAGSMVWVGDSAAGVATPRGFAVRVDPLAGLAGESLGVLQQPNRVLKFPLRVEGPGGALERQLELSPNGGLQQLLEKRIRATSGALGWAAAYDAAPDRVHPMLVVERWMHRDGRERIVDDLGGLMPTWIAPWLGDRKVRDLELVAIVRVTPKLLERCKRCALGDFGWPEVEFRCARVRLDSAVSVVEAKTGRTVVTRAFPGPPPGPCGENVDHLGVRGAAAPEIRNWLLSDVARAPQGADVPLRP